MRRSIRSAPWDGSWRPPASARSGTAAIAFCRRTGTSRTTRSPPESRWLSRRPLSAGSRASRMSSARSDAALLSYLRELIEDNAESVFGLARGEPHVELLSLSRPHGRDESQNRYHRTLTVRYSSAGGRQEKRIWLKFLKSRRV